MSVPINRSNPGVTLRHWSADSLSFMGGSERPSPALTELADGRRLKQMVSMLKQIKAPPAPPSQRPA